MGKNLKQGTILFQELTIFLRRFPGRRWAKTQIAWNFLQLIVSSAT